MVKDVLFISIKEIVSRLLRHPLLQSLDLEQATLYTVDFLHILGLENFFDSKEVVVDIKDYRGELPCDLLQVLQVKNNKTNLCMRSTTDSFSPTKDRKRQLYQYREDDTYKVLNRIIFTSFKEGEVTVAYKAIHTDDEGYPMVIDNSTFLKALELYIKQELFTVLFDCGKLLAGVLQNTQQEYCWYVGKCEAEFSRPSYDEMTSVKNMWTQLVQTTTEEDRGFRQLGNRQYIRNH